MGNSITRIVVLILIAVFCNPGSTLALQDGQESEQPNIPQLIRELESRTFAAREKATQQLVDAGGATLRPLARNLGSSSPEVVYRSRKIIEQIAKSGDETTFLKSAGVLKLVMFGTLEQHYDYMRQLEEDWKQGRTKIAAKTLQEAGAVVTLAEEWNLQNGGFANPLRLSRVSHPQNLSGKPVSKPLPKLSTADFRKAIDQILVGSIDQNRKLVFGSGDPSERGSARKQMLTQLNDQRVWRNRENFRRNGPLGNIGNSASFDANWQGDDQMFAQLISVENLTELKLKEFEINETRIKILQRLSDLDTIELENCTIGKEELIELSELTSVSHFKISKQTNAVEILKKIQEIPNLRGIEIADCDFKNNELGELARCDTLVQILLTGLEVPAETLNKIGRLKRLRYLSMKSCTFDIEAFQALKKQRSNVNFSTVARAFLGVRGPVDFGDAEFECKISEVIPGSGAEKAGVIVGDVITKINEYEIEVFNDLVLYISQHDIGDGLSLEVIRDGKKLKLSAELGERDDSVQ